MKLSHSSTLNKSAAFFKKRSFLIALLISAIITILRSPDIVLNAQFWAEDGHVWFSQMYQDGLSSVFYPRDGYFQSISRIAAGLAILVPLELAPLVMNLVFILVKSFLVAMLFTKRLRYLSASNTLRVFAAAFLLMTPSAQEVHGNVTNAHWFLSVVALLLVLSEESENKIIRFLDYPILIIAGLSGPFSIIIAPPCSYMELS
jgi:hypothetical protein